MFGFNEVIGQEMLKQRIRQDVLNMRMPHALMLAGPTGVGKLPMALALARFLSCPNHTNEDACGECPSCKKWEKLAHPKSGIHQLKVVATDVCGNVAVFEKEIKH